MCPSGEGYGDYVPPAREVWDLWLLLLLVYNLGLNKLSIRHLRHSGGFNGIRTHDLCAASVMLH